MVQTLGNATGGYTYGEEHIALPKAEHTSRRPAHRPWCGDCKKTFDADQLDDDGRCERCARAAQSRAAAEAARAARAAEIAALEKEHRAKAAASARKNHQPVRAPRPSGKKLPTEEKPGEPTTRSSAPRATSASSSSGRAPDAGPSTIQGKNPPAAQETRPDAAGGPLPENALLRDTADHTDPLVAAARIAAVAALETLRRAHELATTGHQSPAAGTGKGKPTRQPATPRPRRAGTDPRKIQLPDAEVVAAYRAGDTCATLAARYGVSAPTISRCLQENNEPRRRERVIHSPEMVAEVRRLYENEHLTQIEIAHRIGRSSKVVQTLMVKAGIDRRPAKARHGADNAVALKQRIADLGVSTADIRAWAEATRHPLHNTRGLPKASLVDDYVTAHQGGAA